jgi:pyruvate formate lyase activating enzyme
MSKKGIVFNIQRYSINDGPGIRTLVFFKGCQLRCLWCSNPESQKLPNEVSYIRKICLLCQRCVQNCPNDSLMLENKNILTDFQKCKVCGKCVEVCPVNARKIEGKEYTVKELFELVNKDKVFFETSGGGLTISGGEPFGQFEFLLKFLIKCKSEGLNITIETCGYTEWNKLKSALPYIDLFLYDIKHMNPKLHEQYTRVDNNKIFNNFKKLVNSGARVIVRFPLIPGYNDDKKNLNEMVKFLNEVNYRDELHLLPYHRLGSNKYQHLSRKYEMEDIKILNNKEIDKIKKFFENEGFIVKLFG